MLLNSSKVLLQLYPILPNRDHQMSFGPGPWLFLFVKRRFTEEYHLGKSKVIPRVTTGRCTVTLHRTTDVFSVYNAQFHEITKIYNHFQQLSFFCVACVSLTNTVFVLDKWKSGAKIYHCHQNLTYTWEKIRDWSAIIMGVGDYQGWGEHPYLTKTHSTAPIFTEK